LREAWGNLCLSVFAAYKRRTPSFKRRGTNDTYVL